jgi:hypothetical protein
MHGWISIPETFQLFLLALAPVVGLAVGAAGARSKHQIALWLGYALTYSVMAVLVAFTYEAHGSGGQYNMAAWGVLVIPVFLYALPAVGLPWLLGRSLVLQRKSPHVSDEGRSVVGIVLLVVDAVVLLAVGAVVLRNMPVPVVQSTYVTPPIDQTQVPGDLSEITNGSDWSCIGLSEGKPTNSTTDYHFDALTAGARWQSFAHHGEQRPFFDLEHAKGIEQFFSGVYSVAGHKLQLGSDYAGMRLGALHQFPKSDQEAMAARHDPRLHGEILIQRNAWQGTMEVISFRSLSPSAMSLVIELRGDVSHTIESACSRVHDPAFRPIDLPPA